jgi:hypothetical protein
MMSSGHLELFRMVFNLQWIVEIASRSVKIMVCKLDFSGEVKSADKLQDV